MSSPRRPTWPPRKSSSPSPSACCQPGQGRLAHLGRGPLRSDPAQLVSVPSAAAGQPAAGAAVRRPGAPLPNRCRPLRSTAAPLPPAPIDAAPWPHPCPNRSRPLRSTPQPAAAGPDRRRSAGRSPARTALPPARSTAAPCPRPRSTPQPLPHPARTGSGPGRSTPSRCPRRLRWLVEPAPPCRAPGVDALPLVRCRRTPRSPAQYSSSTRQLGHREGPAELPQLWSLRPRSRWSRHCRCRRSGPRAALGAPARAPWWPSPPRRSPTRRLRPSQPVPAKVFRIWSARTNRRGNHTDPSVLGNGSANVSYLARIWQACRTSRSAVATRCWRSPPALADRPRPEAPRLRSSPRGWGPPAPAPGLRCRRPPAAGPPRPRVPRCRSRRPPP